MAIDSTTLRSRRAILTGGLVAAVAGTLGRSPVALATDPNDVVLGGFNTATTVTRIANTAGAGSAIEAEATGAGTGIFATSPSGYGVWATSDSSAGVYAGSNSHNGVEGSSSSGHGVSGYSNSTTQASTVGWAPYNTGVQGYCGPNNTTPVSPADTGVYGSADMDATSVGVRGRSPAGSGVIGSSTSGFGTQGISASGTGVYGQSDTNNAIYGFNTTSGAAILGYGQNGEGLRGHTTGASAAAIVGHAYTSTTGVAGISGPGGDPALPLNTGFYGTATGGAMAAGVRGESTTGRGGVFKGNVAQLRLFPSTATTHPTSGALGDLFLDKNKRLWFCKGGTAWKQLA
jgi:hypothetical protein